MKILTIKQPYASLIAAGYKRYEFRSWKTNYRGKILIHAGAGVDKDALIEFKDLNLKYKKFRIVAIADLVDCIELNKNISAKINAENKKIYKDKIRTGYAWHLENIKEIDCDQEIKGKLGLWNIDINL